MFGEQEGLYEEELSVVLKNEVVLNTKTTPSAFDNAEASYMSLISLLCKSSSIDRHLPLDRLVSHSTQLCEMGLTQLIWNDDLGVGDSHIRMM